MNNEEIFTTIREQEANIEKFKKYLDTIKDSHNRLTEQHRLTDMEARLQQLKMMAGIKD